MAELLLATVCMHVVLPGDVYMALDQAAKQYPDAVPEGLPEAIRASLEAVLKATAAGHIENTAKLDKVDLPAALAAIKACVPDIAAGRGRFLTDPDQASPA